MRDQSAVVARCGIVADVEAGAAGCERDGTSPLCGNIRSEPPPMANRIDCGGELALTDLAALDPDEVAILTALGC